MTPTMKAKDVLNRFWDGRLAVDPVAIASRMGVEVFKAPHLKVSGEFSFVDGKPTIFFNPTEPPLRQRFTVAHELGHYLLNHGEKFRDPDYHFSLVFPDYQEVEANRFAAELLMPKEVVKYVFENEDRSTLSGLADKFKVSEVAMKYRLKNLGYL